MFENCIIRSAARDVAGAACDAGCSMQPRSALFHRFLLAHASSRGPGGPRSAVRVFGSRRSYPDTFPPFEQFLRFKSPDKSGPTARATYLTYSGNTKRPQCTRKDPLSWASVRVSGQQVPSTESKLQWKAARKLGPGLCATLRFCSSLGPCTQPRIRRLYSSGLAWAVRCRFRSGW